MWRHVFLFAASVLAGAVNAVAGGGSLLSFPAAIAAGLPPIVANATNAAALVPGAFASAWTYRRSLVGLGRLTALLSLPAVAGAAAGAAILRHTPQRLFDAVVPWLVAGATLLIMLQGLLARRRAAARAPARSSSSVPASPAASMPLAPPAPPAPPAAPAPQSDAERRKRGRFIALAVGAQLLVSVYGGYFGAGMGIIMLAYLGALAAAGTFGLSSVHHMNAVKNVLAVVINGVAAVDFIVHGLVRPDAALIMAAGGIAGGIAGARLARRTDPGIVRRLIVVIGFALAALLAWRRYA